MPQVYKEPEYIQVVEDFEKIKITLIDEITWQDRRNLVTFLCERLGADEESTQRMVDLEYNKDINKESL